MKKFSIKLLLFVICFWAFDKVFLIIRDRAPSLEVDQKLERVLQGKFNHDVLIFGSSLSASGVYAQQLGDSLHCTAYNLSSPGSDIDYTEFILRQFVSHKNKKPKLLVLAVNEPVELFYNKIVNFRFDRIYPLMKYPEIRDEMIVRGEKNKYLSELFVLHQLNKSNLDIRQRHFTLYDTILPCGSMPSSAVTSNFPGGYYDGNRPYQFELELSYKVKKLESFINICNKENIKLLIVFMPRFHTRNFNFEKRIHDIAGSKALYYGHNQNVEAYKNRKYFEDAAHLNFKGARVYTAELAQYIKDAQLLSYKD